MAVYASASGAAGSGSSIVLVRGGCWRARVGRSSAGTGGPAPRHERLRCFVARALGYAQLWMRDAVLRRVEADIGAADAQPHLHAVVVMGDFNIPWEAGECLPQVRQRMVNMEGAAHHAR